MAVKIRSGATTDELTIDAVSKAARFSLYDLLGTYRGVKATYDGVNLSAGFAAANGTGLFLVISGSATKTIIVQRVLITCPTLVAAIGYAAIQCQKYSTAPTGGTAVVFTQVPRDSNSAAGTAGLVQAYTAAPTAGTVVGGIGNQRLLLQSGTAAANALPLPALWDFRAQGESSAVTLRGTAQNIGFNFAAAPGTAVTMCAEVTWTEE
jgi:hypothetical protein